MTNPKGYKKAPWGITTLWGKRKVGKTIASLNSPWQPVHIIDVEFSAEDYENNMAQMIEMGIIKKEFTRASCLDMDSFFAEYKRITDVENAPKYGTIVLDTVGQITQWVTDYEFAQATKKTAEKMSQIVWGRVRNRIRSMLLMLVLNCNLLILTAHEKEYQGVKSPRCNPAILELASLSMRLTRTANQKIPDGIVDIARLPVFPPRIPQFTIASLLQYVKKPADWDNLNEDEKVQDELLIAEKLPEDQQ